MLFEEKNTNYVATLNCQIHPYISRCTYYKYNYFQFFRLKVDIKRKKWGTEETEQCLPCSQVFISSWGWLITIGNVATCKDWVLASVETPLCRKVAFAGIEDESESGSDSGRNGQESEASLSEVSSQYERWSILKRGKVGLGANIGETNCQLMLFQVWVKQPDVVRQCDSQ